MPFFFNKGLAVSCLCPLILTENFQLATNVPLPLQGSCSLLLVSLNLSKDLAASVIAAF